MTATSIPAANYGIVDAQRLADFFGVSRDTLDRRRDQLPPCFQLGRRKFWHLDTVIEHIRKTGVKIGDVSADRQVPFVGGLAAEFARRCEADPVA